MELDKQQLFLQLYDDFADAVFRHCYFRLSDREKAKDLMQETFKKVWQHLIRGGGIDNKKAFVYKVANNLIIDSYRKKKDESLDAMMNAGFDPGEDHTESIMTLIFAKKIEELLETLDDKYREAIVMRYIDGFSPKEIAEITSETENNVSVRIYRGLKKLREMTELSLSEHR